MLSKLRKIGKWIWYSVRYGKSLRAFPLSTVIGSGVKFLSSDLSKSITLGERVTMCDRVNFETGPGASITVGDNAWISKDVMIAANASIGIGANTMIGEFSSIRDAEHGCESTEIPMRFQGLTAESIQIGDDVWIGRGVAVLKGVTIGKGSIVGANAVVTRDIPDYSIAVGIPARVVKTRKL
jgi:serine acetyltransferase